MDEEEIGSARMLLMVGAAPVVIIGVLFALWSLLTNGLGLFGQIFLIPSYFQGENLVTGLMSIWGLLIGIAQIVLYAVSAAVAAFGAFKASRLQTAADLEIGLGAVKIVAASGVLLIVASFLSCFALSCSGFVTGMVGSMLGGVASIGCSLVANGKLTAE